MWTGNTTGGKVLYVQREELEKAHSELVQHNKQLLKKIDAIVKLVEQTLNILLSYNPKLAEQTKEELEKINEQTDDKSDKSQSDTSG
jgi:beta-lactamase regulating signal transducer with metallopeptidase domain